MSLFDPHTVTIQRQSVENTGSASDRKTYSTSARGGLPSSLKCRVVPLSSAQRTQYATVDQRISHRVFFLANPQVDERDKLVFCVNSVDVDLFVISARTPDHLGRFYIVECAEFTGPM